MTDSDLSAIVTASFAVGFATAHLARVLNAASDRASDWLISRWRRLRRRRTGWVSVGDPAPRHINCRCTIKPMTVQNLPGESDADCIERLLNQARAK